MSDCCNKYKREDELRSNITKDVETNHLVIKPSCCENSLNLNDYIRKKEINENAIEKYHNDSLFADKNLIPFDILLKNEKENVFMGNITLRKYENDIGDMSFYFKNEYKNKHYEEEAIDELLQMLSNNLIIQKNDDGQINEIKINCLRCKIFDEDNYSANILKKICFTECSSELQSGIIEGDKTKIISFRRFYKEIKHKDA